MAEFHEHVTADREKSTKRNLEGNCDRSCKYKWRKSDMPAILKAVDSNNRAHAVNVVITHLKTAGVSFTEFDEVSFYTQYDRDIIKMRNNLAHCVEAVEADGKPVLKTRGGDVSFTEADIVEIRKKILFYNKVFDRIVESLR